MATCFQCGERGSKFLGYVVCDACKSKLGLFGDDTIKKHIARYRNAAKNHDYEDEVNERLQLLEIDYIKKRLKLLHIQERIQQLQGDYNPPPPATRQ